MASSLCFLHSLAHSKRFAELSREEKVEGEDRVDLGEKKENQKGERIIKPVITLYVNMGMEYWTFKCTNWRMT